MLHADFHMHTTISDGVWSPDELLTFIRGAEFDAFAITDHDTMDVYPIPADLTSRCIPGMEVDTKCDGFTAHILVYGITSPEAPLLQHLRAQRAARRERMDAMVARLHGRGVAVTMGDVEKQAGQSASLGRPHLARALVALGVVANVQEAFDVYLADDREGYVSLDRLESVHAIELAHASGAVAVVAHPVRLREPRLLDALQSAGIDGVEVFHPSADVAARTQLAQYACDRGLLITGGSDFHAPAPGYEPGIEIEAEHVERLLEAVASAA